MTDFVEVIVAVHEVVEVNLGARGLPGDEGLSAYEVALDAGYEGTEAEWLASLRGEPRTWSDLSGRPDAFPPAPHQHEIADVPGLADALDGKQPSGDYATAAQGALADTAVQPGDLAAVATTGAYADLSGLPALGTAAAVAVEDFAAAARGVPAGGAAGQVLTKSSAADYAAEWADPSGGGDVTQAAFDALTAYAQTTARLASPNAGPVYSFSYYVNSFSGTTLTTLAGVADRMELAPMFFGRPLTIRELGCSVTTAVAGAQVKVVIYEEAEDGLSGTLVYETAPLDASTTGGTYADLTGIGGLTLDAGKTYWMGLRYSANPTVRAVNLGSCKGFGVTSSGGNSLFTVLRTSIDFATPAPDTLVFSGLRAGNVPPPAVYMRAA